MEPEKLFFYQLRYDSHNIEFFQNLCQDPHNIIQSQGYCLGFESKQDGTPHIQMMFANEFELSQNEKTKIREYIKKQINVNYKNAVSITTAKFPHALYNYCTKTPDTDVTFSGEIISYINTLPIDIKKQFKDTLSNYISTQKDTNLKEFYINISKFYLSHDKELPRRNKLLTLAVKYNKMRYTEYLDEIGLITCKDRDCPHCNYPEEEDLIDEYTGQIFYTNPGEGTMTH